MKPWLNMTQAAKYAGVDPKTFLDWRRRGLRIAEIGCTKRTSEEWIDEFIKSHELVEFDMDKILEGIR